MAADSRVLKRIDTSKGIDACWPWQGACDQNGYGRISRVTYGESLAHRYVMKALTGLSPEAWMHECDNPPCCNPLHLTAGDRKQNNQQAWARGLHAEGERHPDARLTATQVAEIREMVASGSPQARVAEKFGVSPSHVSRIVNFHARKAA